MAMYSAGSISASINAATGSNSEAILYQIQPFVTARGANDGQIAGARILDEIVHNGAGAFDAYYATQQPDPEGNVTYVCGAKELFQRHHPTLARRKPWRERTASGFFFASWPVAGWGDGPPSTSPDVTSLANGTMQSTQGHGFATIVR
jgi:hypothetical protein